MAGEFIDIAEILYRARYRLWIEPTKIGTMLCVEVMDCCVYCSTEIFDQLTDAGFRLNFLDGIYRRKAAAQGRQEKED